MLEKKVSTVRKSLKSRSKKISSVYRLPRESVARSAATAAENPEPWYYEKQKTSDLAPLPAVKTGPSWRCRIFALAVFIFPFLAWPWTVAPQEFPKQVWLILITAGGFLILALESYHQKRVLLVLPRHLFSGLGFLFIAVAAFGALRSGVPYQSFIGYGGTESLAWGSMLFLGLWLILSFHAGKETLKLPLWAVGVSGSLLSLLTLSILLGFSPYRWFIGWEKFNPAGTTTTVSIIAAVTAVLFWGLFWSAFRRGQKIFYLVGLLPPLFLLGGLGFKSAWGIFALGLLLLLILRLVFKTETLEKRTRLELPATVLILAITVLGLLQMRSGWLTTPLEVGPTHRETLAIIQNVLRAAPLLGSGPATFAQSYLQFRSLPILKTPFWNVTFDWGSSTALTLLGTLGFLGGGLLLVTLLSILMPAWFRFLFQNRVQLMQVEALPIQQGLTSGTTAFIIPLLASASSLFVAFFIVPGALSLRFLFVTLLGLLLSQQAEFWQPRRAAQLSKYGLAGLVSLLIIFAVFSIFRRVAAEYVLVRKFNAAESREERLRFLDRVIQLDPFNDAYRRLQAEFLVDFLSNSEEIASFSQSQILILLKQAEQAALLSVQYAPLTAANWATLGRVRLAAAHLEPRQSQAAQEAFTRAQTLSPADPAIQVNLALAHTLADPQKGLVAARQELVGAIDLRPTFAPAHLALARLLSAQNPPDKEALNAYQQAKNLVPNDPVLRYEIGLFLLSQEKNPEAQQELEEAVRLAPNFSNARFALAQVYEKQGALSLALAQIQQVVTLNPDHPLAQARLAELQKKAEKKK